VFIEDKAKAVSQVSEWHLVRSSASRHITAVYKKGNKSDPSNYRPIRLTSIICKLMESIIRDHNYEFFLQIPTLVLNNMALSKADLLPCNY